MSMSYRDAIAWIARNDEPTGNDAHAVADQLAVTLIADLMGKDPVRVAIDVMRYRIRHKIK